MKVTDKMLEWENGGKPKLLSAGYSLREPQLLFRKLEDAEVAEQVEKLKAKRIRNTYVEKPAASSSQQVVADILTGEAATQKQPADHLSYQVKEAIQIDDFAKADLRVGTILSAEKIPKSDKLLKLEVDLGFEVRTIVSGIALHFEAAAILGRQVVVVANLAPRKMRGIESNGMILMAEDKNGKLFFISAGDIIDNGSGVS